MFEGLLLQERPRLSDWCERNLVLPRRTSPNAPGRLSFDRTPYLREIIDCYFDPSVETVWVSGGSQIGKTVLLLSIFAGIVGLEPANGIWAMTSLDQMRAVSRKRIMEFMRANPVLARHIKDWEPGSFKSLEYELDHMDVKLVGVGSPANLSSEPCAWVIADEAAKYPWVRKDEAPPTALLQERTKAFPRRFHIFTSTPTTVENEFWQGVVSGDMREYFVPCPYCGQEFAFDCDSMSLHWEKRDGVVNDIDLAEQTARYICPHCRGDIWNDMKADMVARGHWAPSERLRTEYGRELVDPSSKVRSYVINSLYSPFISFGQYVRKFLETLNCQNVATELQNLRNSWQALPYEFTRVTVKQKHVSALCGEHHRGQVPDEYYFISVGYDPGGDQTHWVAMAVCDGGDVWVIDWGTILNFRSETHLENEGTDEHPRWRTVVDKPGIAPHFRGLRWGLHGPSVAFVDAGYSTGDIYDECLMCPGQLQPTKGSAARVGTWFSRGAGPKWGSLEVISYSDYQLKLSLYGRTLARGDRPRLILPKEEDCEAELFAGLSGQKLVMKGTHDEWRKVADDHYGDCIKLGGRLAWWVLKDQFEEPDRVE